MESKVSDQGSDDTQSSEATTTEEEQPKNLGQMTELIARVLTLKASKNAYMEVIINLERRVGKLDMEILTVETELKKFSKEAGLETAPN